MIMYRGLLKVQRIFTRKGGLESIRWSNYEVIYFRYLII